MPQMFPNAVRDAAKAASTEQKRLIGEAVRKSLTKDFRKWVGKKMK